MGNVDVRIFAAILVIIGVFLGLSLSGTVLLIMTAVLVIAAVMIFRILVGPPAKRTCTSGETGAFLLVVGAVACILIPIWIVYLARSIGK